MRFPVIGALIAVLSVFTFASVEGQNMNELLCKVNRERVQRGLKPLGLASGLTQAAQSHANAQLRYRKLAHILPDGRTPQQRVRSTSGGSKWKSVAENALQNGKSVDEVFRRLRASPGHFRNMMGPYTHMGAARAGTTTSNYWSQTFANDGGRHNFPVCPGR